MEWIHLQVEAQLMLNTTRDANTYWDYKYVKFRLTDVNFYAQFYGLAFYELLTFFHR